MSLTLSAILLTVAFVVPGFIANCARRRYAIRRRLSGTDLILECLVASTFLYLGVCLLCFFLGRGKQTIINIAKVAAHKDWQVPPMDEIWTLAKWYCFLLLASVVTGGLCGIYQQKEPLTCIIHVPQASRLHDAGETPAVRIIRAKAFLCMAKKKMEMVRPTVCAARHQATYPVEHGMGQAFPYVAFVGFCEAKR